LITVTAKIRNLHDFQLRLLHGIVPVPSGFDIANTIKNFSQTLLCNLHQHTNSNIFLISRILCPKKRCVERRAVVAVGDAAQLRAGLCTAGAVPQPGLQGPVQRHRAADGRGAAHPIRHALVRAGGVAVSGLSAVVPRRGDNRLVALSGRQLHGRAARLAAPGDRQHPLLLHTPLHHQYVHRYRNI
jgi:hypothetical protein